MSINSKFQTAWAVTKALPRNTKRWLSKHRYDFAGYSISVLFYLFVFFFYFCVSFAVTTLAIQSGMAVLLAVIIGAIAAIMLGIPVANVMSVVHNDILLRLSHRALAFEDEFARREALNNLNDSQAHPADLRFTGLTPA